MELPRTLRRKVPVSEREDGGAPRAPHSTLTNFFTKEVSQQAFLPDAGLSTLTNFFDSSPSDSSLKSGRSRKRLAQIEPSITVPHAANALARVSEARYSLSEIPEEITLVLEDSRKSSKSSPKLQRPEGGIASFTSASQQPLKSALRPSLMLRQVGSDALINRRAPDELCGFVMGEEVTTSGGPDERGPWRSMGYGTIIGPGFKRGFLNVQYMSPQGRSEDFSIKAKNLRKAAQEASFGSYERLNFGDTMTRMKGYNIQTTSLMGNFGTAAMANPVPQLMVRQRAEERHRAGLERDDGLYYGVKLGGFVRALRDPWMDMGIGIAKKPGERPGTVCVRFNIMGEVWTLECADLENVADPGDADFRSLSRNLNVQYPAKLKTKKARKVSERPQGFVPRNPRHRL